MEARVPPSRRTRDRRGRGMRGPGVVPAVPGTTFGRSKRQRFDDLVLGVVADVEKVWHDRLGLVEYAVEETPVLPPDWGDEVPLASLVPGRQSTPARLVVFRQPVVHRAASQAELEALVFTVVVEQMAELLGLAPESVHPRYRVDDE
ncbi:MAG: metallopeptidase family protein [Nocardioides sp.]|uniref:metallopeptidase family protein n=1 Tax=Nocardioides sp. TaxID=35761 RepID=UPI003F0278CE